MQLWYWIRLTMTRRSRSSLGIKHRTASWGMATYDLAKWLSKILRPLVGSSGRILKDTKDLVEIMDEVALSEDKIVVSFDVKSLFTSIPVDEAISICAERLKGDDTVEKRTKMKVGTIVKLLQFCLKSTEFVHGGVLYKQLDGVAMHVGSPVSPVVADIFMDELEKKAFEELEAPPRIWHRFVDDVISVINSLEEAVLLDHLNEQHPRITFTMERENDWKMPFMDKLFKRGEEEKLDRAVYRKPTHTGRCLSFDSHNPASVKRGIVRGFVSRAIKVCSDEESKKVEIDHKWNAGKWLSDEVRDQLKKASVTPQSSKDSKDDDTNKEEWQKARIPFIEGVSYEVRRIARDETFGDQKRHRLVCGKLLEKHDPARITQKLYCCKLFSYFRNWASFRRHVPNVPLWEHLRNSERTHENQNLTPKRCLVCEMMSLG